MRKPDGSKAYWTKPAVQKLTELLDVLNSEEKADVRLDKLTGSPRRSRSGLPLTSTLHPPVCLLHLQQLPTTLNSRSRPAPYQRHKLGAGHR